MNKPYKPRGGVYGEFGKDKPMQSKDLRPFFFDFFKQFKEYLAEYVRESLVELKISSIELGEEPLVLFDGEVANRVTLKNQGFSSCVLTTDGQGGYRLDPGEEIPLWVNRSIVATTLSGTTTLGYVRY